MNHYITILILPDLEFSVSELMNAVFSKLHRALVKAATNKIGISFPKAGVNLGNTLRLHGSKEQLTQLMEINWLKALSDYTEVFSIQIVPEKCKYRVVSRIQAKSNVSRLYRRSLRKGWLSQEEAEKRMLQKKEQFFDTPFVKLKSLSSRQNFRLFIKQGPILDQPIQGIFSAYGLSQQATIPWF